jgi:sucrose-6-phosphate hydrolase SacC (GH32 family)
MLFVDNPTGATWANMTWLHATSKNLIHWEHVSAEPSLIPSVPHDQEGIFSGCMLLHGPQGEEGMMTAIYTAVRVCHTIFESYTHASLAFTDLSNAHSLYQAIQLGK